MGNRAFKPITPSRRAMTTPDFTDLVGVQKPLKKLTKSNASSAGRNNQGRISVRFRGGGHKQRFRDIDFCRNKFDVPAKVVGIQYDPNRSARIALLHYADGEKGYILAPVGL